MIRNLFTIVIVFLGLITFSYSQDQIAYLELDKVINNSLKKESIKQAYKNIIKYNTPFYFAEFVKLFREI